MQLQVVKADSSIEQYLHTKVMATLSCAMSSCGEVDSFVAEELAEAITFYLYNNYHQNKITSNEILSIITASLASTGHFRGADALMAYHHKRNLLRNRIEVSEFEVENLEDAEKLSEMRKHNLTSRWNKSYLVNYLVKKLQIKNDIARTIASLVEKKIIESNFRCMPKSFIKHLALSQTFAIMRAKEELVTHPVCIPLRVVNSRDKIHNCLSNS